MAARILLVEDDDNQRTLYAQELEGEGYDVVEACDGVAALQEAHDAPPDLVVLDVHMPRMEGLEALGKLLGSGRRVPVVLHTAYQGYRDNFMSWAADAYVVKSPDLTELMETIRALLAGGG